MKKLYVTIDTEMDSDIHWKKNYPPKYTSVIEGIPQILRPLWDKYNVHPIYFVSPEVLYEEACCRVLRDEIEKGAVVGAHLHPEYIEPNSRWGEGIDTVEAEFPCVAYSKDIEYEKLKNLTKLIEDKLGIRPVWYRAARFGANLDTMYNLQKLGYEYDSSVTPFIDWSSKGGPNHARGLERPYRISKVNYYQEAIDTEKALAIKEYPITIDEKRFGVFGRFLPENWMMYKWLRPTHMTYLEQRQLIRKMAKKKQDSLVMMFHSMEVMINKSPYVRSRWMQRYYLWRLEKTIAYGKALGYQL